jgi:hypothetical protein
MNAVVVAIVAVGLTGLFGAVGYLIMGFNRTRMKAEQMTKVLDAIIVLERSDAAKKETIEKIQTEMQRTERVYAGFFEALRIQMAEFNTVAKTVNALQLTFERMDEKIDERDKEATEFRTKIVDGLHAINVELVKRK